MGLFCTILGMAVGTGNIWRFPREVAANNGGAFVLMCFAALFFWAVPLIAAESVIGKKTRLGNAGGFRSLLGEKYTWIGALAGLVCCLLGAYYTAVLGWVVKYLILILTGFLGEVKAGGMGFAEQYFKDFALTFPAKEAWLWFVGAIALTAFFIFRGVQGGIEKANKVLIPGIFIIFFILLARVLMMDNAVKGLEYMYHVDVKDFTNPRIWLAAFTQAAWSSGAGWGMYHVYYVYSSKDEDIQLNSFCVTFGDMAAAMLAGMVILPALFAMSPDPYAAMKAGANGLTFVHLTNLFAHTTGGFFMAVLFFLGLCAAALSTTIAMIELGTRNLIDMGFSRTKATIYVSLFFLIVGSMSALDSRIFDNQDMVWGVFLLMNGLIYMLVCTKYGLDKLWNEDIAPCSDINVKWLWYVIKLFPLEFLFVWGWWMIDAASWYPGEWFKFWPITKYQYTPGVMVFEWAIVIIICFALNGKFNQLLTRTNKK